LFLASSSTFVSGADEWHCASRERAGAQAKDIVETAVAAGDFKTLATALGAAGLVDTLKGKGPLTVFAPTDAAFAKIPRQTSRR